MKHAALSSAESTSNISPGAYDEYGYIGGISRINCNTTGIIFTPHWSINAATNRSADTVARDFPNHRYINKQLVITNLSQMYDGYTYQCTFPEVNQVGIQYTLYVTTGNVQF